MRTMYEKPLEELLRFDPLTESRDIGDVLERTAGPKRLLLSWLQSQLNVEKSAASSLMLEQWSPESNLGSWSAECYYSITTTRLSQRQILNDLSTSLIRDGLQPSMLHFWKGKGTKAFHIGKGHPMTEEIVNFYWCISRASRQWPGAWRQSPSQPLSNIRTGSELQ